MPLVEPICNYHCVVGENPLWHPREQRLYWEDIDTGRLFRFDPASGQHECFYEGDKIGGFTFQADGSLLLFEANRIAVLDGSGRRRVLGEGYDPEMSRFNDVIADPEGRVFAGTIGASLRSGGLLRIERDGSAEVLWRDTGCANGMGFTPDGRGFYWTCSTTRRIFSCDYDRATGTLANRRVWYEAPESEGTPDGMTVDTQGRVWTTRWDGSAVLCLSPQAEVLQRVELPVPKVSSICFGGPGLDDAYLTTAALDRSSDAGSAEGSLYRIRGLGAAGQAEHFSRVAL
jgi:sugar lactone lactonase YvrE